MASVSIIKQFILYVGVRRGDYLFLVADSGVIKTIMIHFISSPFPGLSSGLVCRVHEIYFTCD